MDQDALLASGAVRALRLPVAQSSSPQAGSNSMLASARGLPSHLTVSAHSDKGGVVRRVLGPIGVVDEDAAHHHRAPDLVHRAHKKAFLAASVVEQSIPRRGRLDTPGPSPVRSNLQHAPGAPHAREHWPPLSWHHTR